MLYVLHCIITYFCKTCLISFNLQRSHLLACQRFLWKTSKKCNYQLSDSPHASSLNMKNIESTSWTNYFNPCHACQLASEISAVSSYFKLVDDVILKTKTFLYVFFKYTYVNWVLF